MMDELARTVGWWVIGIVAFYAVGKVIIAAVDASDNKRNSILHTDDLERRLAFRRIYRSTHDPLIREEVKSRYGAWVLLDLDVSDSDYHDYMIGSDTRSEYEQALRNIEEKGYLYEVEDGKIVFQPSKMSNNKL